MGSNLSFSSRGKKRGSGILWFVLAIVFVAFMLKWGVPGIINVLAGPSGPKAANVNPADDIVPPQVPSLNPLPEATNSATISMEGFTEAEIEVAVWRNGELAVSDKSDDKGAFKIGLNLNEGENRLQVKARDGAGNESQSVVKIINFDKKGVEVTIDSPSDGAEVFGKNNQIITVSGKVSKADSSVSVNGNFARVDTEGKYSATVRLSEGDNQINVSATDKAGNTTQKTVKVKLTL